MTKGCKRSVLFFGKFKQDVLPVCIGNVLSANSTFTVGMQNTPGKGSSGSVSATAGVGGKVGSVMAEGQVGAKIDVDLPKNKVPKISAKMVCGGKVFVIFLFSKATLS